MMNMIELQDKLKNFSQDQLIGMMQQPTGEAPQFMVLGEITRRQKMQQEATKAPTQSVAQEAVSAAGVPQGGIADMARTLAPQTNVAQNTGVMSAPPQGMPSAPQGIAKMASGGVIKMAPGGPVDLDRAKKIVKKVITEGPDSLTASEMVELDGMDNRLFNSLAMEIGNESSGPTAPAELNTYAANLAPAITPTIDVTSEAAMAASMAPSMAPSMPTPPKTDSVFQGPRPSTTGGIQVDIAGNIYAVLGDGSVIDQTGRTPPPPVAELARQKAGTPAAQFTTQQQYQDAQNLANRIGANSGENAVLPSENLLMGGGREGTPFLNQAPAADTAIYGGGYDPQSRAATSATGLAALSPETMPTVGGPAAPPQIDLEAYLKSIYPDYGQEDVRRPRYDTAIGPQPAPVEKNFSPYSGAYIPPEYLGKETIESVVKLPGQAIDFIAPAFENEFSELTPQELDTMTEAQARALQAERLASKKPETKDTPLEKSDLAAGLTDDMKPKARPEDLFTTTKQKNDAAAEATALLGGASKGTTGSGSGSGGASSYETKLLEMLSRQEANAKSDKWMALAQAGMSLMQGGTGSFGGDLGKAGQTGLAALQSSRASNDKSQLDILSAIEASKLKREAIAASRAKSSGLDSLDFSRNITAIDNAIEVLNNDMTMAPAVKQLEIAKLMTAKNEELRKMLSLTGGSLPKTPQQKTVDVTNPSLFNRAMAAVGLR